MSKKYEIAIGILLGPLIYCALSVASAFWLAGSSSPLHAMSILISAVVFCGLGAISYRLSYLPLSLSALMLVMLAAALALGGSAYAWVAPFPQDVASLFLHGAQSPLVFGAAAVVFTSSVLRLLSLRARRRLSGSSA